MTGITDIESERTDRARVPWPGFLTDEARPPAPGVLLGWVDGLLARPPADEDLFVAANLIALVAFRAGDVRLARDISHAEIAYALRREADGPEYLMYALQPQINLLRIDGSGPDPGAALRGLARMGRLASGLPVDFPALGFSAERIDRLDRAGQPVRRVARTTHVVETCKILARHRRWEDLAAAGSALLAAYPDLGETGPHHAAEALWLGAAADQSPPSEAALDGRAVPAVRAAFVQLTHHTAHLADIGAHDDAVARGMRLLARWDVLDGRFSAPTTPLRWRASLADSVLRAGRRDLAEPVLEDVFGESAGDPVLHRGVADRLGVPGVAGAPWDEAGMAALAGRVLDRLGG
jgi:hypothetical protein